MLAIPSALQAKLASGVTTLAHCWIVRRRDGDVRGYTDHDCDLAVGDVTCRAGTGFAASEASTRFDLSSAGAEIAGALSDDTLSDADLAAGRYDAASIETWLVDWSEPTLKVRLARGTLGEVRRDGDAFTAELRGLADTLSQETGRLYTATCTADLGDAKCRVDLTSGAWRGTGAVSAVLGDALIAVSGLDGFTAGLFTAGKLRWSSGANEGAATEIKLYTLTAGVVRLSLWQATAETIAVGNTFVVTAGCDKRFSTCRDRFANVENFRGFPQIPGNDFVLGNPVATAAGSVIGGKE